MSRKSASGIVSWATGDGDEEALVLARMPSSRRLRRIFQDLETIVHSEGFLHLTVSDLAARLRCSKMTLYRLAPSREELFEVVIDVWLARCRDLGRRQFESAESWNDRLLGFLNAAIVAMRPMSFEFMRDLRAFPGGRRAILAHQARRVADLERIIEAGVRAGAFNEVNPRIAADILLLTMRRFIEPEFLMASGVDVSQAVDEAYKVIEFGLIRTASSSAELSARNLSRPTLPLLRTAR